MVLLHGVGLRAEAWEPMLPHLEKRFALSVLDMPGHGESRPFDQQPVLGDYTREIAKAIDSPSVIVGHSMGALIAADLAIRHPGLVSGVVPLNAVFRRSDEARRAVARRAKDIVENGNGDPTETLTRWFGKTPEGSDKAANTSCQQWLTKVDPKGYAHAYSVFAREDGPSDTALAALHCPALFITGSEEPNSTPDMSRRLADRVPDGRAEIISGARHMMPMTHAEKVCGLLIDWHRVRGFDHG